MMYEQEGVPYDNIVFEDNKECVDLIEAKPIGMLSLLEEECSLGKGTDVSFVGKMAQAFTARGAAGYNK